MYICMAMYIVIDVLLVWTDFAKSYQNVFCLSVSMRDFEASIFTMRHYA